MYTYGISIALLFQSLDPRWGLEHGVSVLLYTFKIYIALGYLSRSLFGHLIYSLV